MTKVLKLWFCALVTMCSLAWGDVVTPLGTTISTYQVAGAYTRDLAIYDSSLFSGIEEIKIEEIAFWPSPFVAGPVTPIDMYLGTTTVSSADINPRYSDDITSGETLAFAGTVNSTLAGGGDNFGMVVHLDMPYVHVPAKGNFLLDVQNTGDELQFPYAYAIDGSVHMVTGVNPVGSTNGGAYLIQLSGVVTSVPEPCAFPILTVCLMVLAIAHHRTPSPIRPLFKNNS